MRDFKENIDLAIFSIPGKSRLFICLSLNFVQLTVYIFIELLTEELFSKTNMQPKSIKR